MKIKSNKTFDCYETAYESWRGGKDVTLDGVKLIPITILDKIRAEIEEYKSRQLTLAIGVEDLEKGKQIALEYALAILDKHKVEVESQEGRNKYSTNFLY